MAENYKPDSKSTQNIQSMTFHRFVTHPFMVYISREQELIYNHEMYSSVELLKLRA